MKSNFAPGDYQYDLFVANARGDDDWVQGYLIPALGLPSERTLTRRDFRPGTPEVNEFERGVAHSRYTVLILSPDYVTDEWAVLGEELASYASLTEWRDRLIPLLLHPVKLPLRIGFRVQLDCTDTAHWEREIARLRGLLDHPEPTLEQIPCPYPGMVPFAAKDARFFYGRESEIREMLQRLRVQRTLYVIGPSGCGKSSLISAGVLPRFRDNASFHSRYWTVRTIRPGAHPVQALARELGHETLYATLADLDANHDSHRQLLLVVDPFEEVFTQAKPEQRADFFRALKSLESREWCTLLFSMRADFYPDLMNSELWPVPQEYRMEITPLRGEALRQAIRQPALDVGVYLEANLLERLMANAAEELGALPFVQETMKWLWEQMQRRFLSLLSYESLGSDGRSGLAVAMARHADATLAGLSESQRAIVRRIMLRLVQFGEGRADTRRQQPVAALLPEADRSSAFDETLRHLVAHRLLILGGEEQGKESVADIAHEALITGWPTLKRWIEERRSEEQTRRRLEAKAQEWVRLYKAAGLLDAAELAEAEKWLAGTDPIDQDQNLLQLVGASRQAIENMEKEKEAFRQRELAQARALADEQRKRGNEQSKAAKRLRLAVGGLGVALLATVVILGYAVKQTALAENRLRIALSRQLATHAERMVTRQSDLALLLATEALRGASPFEAPRIFLEALTKDARLLTYLHADAYVPADMAMLSGAIDRRIGIDPRHRGIESVAFNHDGTIMASGTRAGTIILWDIASRRPLGDPLRPPESLHGVTTLAFSPHDQILASGSDETVILWDLTRLRPLRDPISIGEGRVASLAFSPDGKILAIGSFDRFSYGEDRGQILLWDIVADRWIREKLRSHVDGVWGLAFSPISGILASGSGDHTIILWDVVNRKELGDPIQEGDQVWSVAFSPDGKTLASASGENITLWNIPSGGRKGLLRGHSHDVKSVVFISDQVLASGSWDNSILLWDVTTRKPLGKPLAGHNAEVYSVAYNPQKKILASGSLDDKIILWNPTNHYRYGGPLEGGTHAQIVAFNPNSSTLGSVSPSGRGKLTLWNVQFARRKQENSLIDPAREYHHSVFDTYAFSPDFRVLASGGDDTVITLWSVETGQPLSVLPLEAIPIPLGGDPLQPTAVVDSLAFSPDGRILASGNNYATVILWDVATRIPLGKPLTGHPSSVTSLAFSPNGRILASGSHDGDIILWDIRKGKRLGKTLTGHEQTVNSIAFSPNGRLLASGSADGNVLLWDVRRRKRLGEQLLGHEGKVSTVAFTADGRVLASGGKDESIIFWDVATRRPLGRPLPRHDSVRSIAFSRNGKNIAFATVDGYVHLWETDFEMWINQACAIVNRNLTSREWRQFVGSSIPYRRTCPKLPDG